jgi:hypothetical protein
MKKRTQVRFVEGTPEQRTAVEGFFPEEIAKGWRCAGVLLVPVAGDETIRVMGQLRYRDGFDDVWLGDEHYDLRRYTKARLCLEYLVENGAYTVERARHFLEEIDPYVREKGGFIKLEEIRIHDYFRDPSGRIAKLRQGLVAAGHKGKYYLKTGAA